MRLFGNKNKGRNKGSVVAAMINEKQVQPAAKQRKTREFYDPINGVVVDRNRWFVLTVILAIALLLVLALLHSILPTKQVVPYVLEIDPETSRAVQTSRLQYYKPARPDIAFAATDFTEQLLGIQRHFLKPNLVKAQERTCGAAREQVNQFIRESRPQALLITDPSAIRTVHFPSDPVFPPNEAENTIIMRVRTVTSTVADGNKDKREEQYWVMTLNYILRVPGKKVTFEEFRNNPIGICWTSFFITKEDEKAR